MVSLAPSDGLFSLHSLLLLFLAQGLFGGVGFGFNGFNGYSVRIFAIWNLLDCVGAHHPVVPSCKAIHPAADAGCHAGK